MDESSQIRIEVLNLTKKYDNDDEYLFRNFNLEIKKKKTALFGPNGCGKTTLLRMLSGLDRSYTGRINFYKSGRTLRKPRIGYAFQNPSRFLLPWLNNFENITFPLHLRGISEKERREIVDELVSKFEINIPLGSYPYQLSGGQCQILVFLRSIIDTPDVIFLDEPFSNLDYLNKTKFLFDFTNEKFTDPSAVLISHTVEEAIIFADEIILLKDKPLKIISRIQVPLKREKRTTGMLDDKMFSDIKRNILNQFKAYL